MITHGSPYIDIAVSDLSEKTKKRDDDGMIGFCIQVPSFPSSAIPVRDKLREKDIYTQSGSVVTCAQLFTRVRLRKRKLCIYIRYIHSGRWARVERARAALGPVLKWSRCSSPALFFLSKLSAIRRMGLFALCVAFQTRFRIVAVTRASCVSVLGCFNLLR